MNPKKYAALAVDLDGTLIGKDQQVSPRVAEAVGGIAGTLQVSIASGREPSDVLDFARQLRLTSPQISDNGALILEPGSGRALWSSPLGQANAKSLAAELCSLGISFMATHPGGTITDPAKIIDWDLTRVSALDLKEEFADDLVARFTSRSDLHVVKVSLPYNGLWAVDFTHAGVDKATAVRQLARILDIDTRQIIAAGDSYNDLPLLEECGLGIAMDDAPDELKAMADYIAPSVDDDGLAVAIEEFVLPRL